MDIKIIFSSGGKFNKNPDQKIADNDTVDAAKKIASAIKQNGHSADLVRITPSKISMVKAIKADAVFNLCEWSGKDYPLGVDVLKTLEENKIPFTGGDSKSYEWCCDKISMKKIFEKNKIPTPPWAPILLTDTKKIIENKIKALKFPIIVKPAYEHCAIGIDFNSIIHNKKFAVKKIISHLKKFNQPILVEEFIRGREFTITVVKNHKLHVFPPAEVKFFIDGPDKLLTFKAEWVPKKANYESCVTTDKDITLRLAKLARYIFNKMHCKGYVRIDTRVRGGNIYVLEVNINPSLLPDKHYGLTVSTAAYGWTFNKLIGEITNSAVSSRLQN